MQAQGVEEGSGDQHPVVAADAKTLNCIQRVEKRFAVGKQGAFRGSGGPRCIHE